MNLAKNIKTNTAKIAILGIIPKRYTFNHKAKQVNSEKGMERKEHSIHFVLWC